MKRLLLLTLLLAASAPAQNIILGVLETGDYTIAIDTNTFFWFTLPDAQFVPWDWGGDPGTTDTFRFDLLPPNFPPNVWIDYSRNGSPMPRETIPGLVPDAWYDLPRFDKAPTRVKFLPQPGVEEGSTPGARRYALQARPNPFRARTAIKLSSSALITQRSSLSVCDASGRLVRSLAIPRSLAPDPYSLLWDGRDQSGRAVAAGVYVCRVRTNAPAPALRLVKLD